MHWLPFILACVAVVFFLVDYFRPGLKMQPLGLAFLAAAFILVYVIRTNSGLLIIH